MTATERANAVLLAAYTDKLKALRTLILSVYQIDVNRADKDGNTPLHWAVHHRNLSMIKLLLAHGAMHQVNHEDETPADIAEKNDDLDVFNLLVHHFLIKAFQTEGLVIEDHDVIVDLDLTETRKDLKKIEPKISNHGVSANTLKLLLSLNIKASGLEGIELEDIEQATDPSFLGKCLYFMVSSSLIRSAMLLPWMNRSSIKLAQNQPTKTVSDRRDNLRISTISDTGDDEALLLASDMITTEEENESFLEKEITADTPENKIKTSADFDTNENELKIIKTKSCYAPILTSSGLLFESESVLSGVSAVNAFYETIDTSIIGIWNGFISSLIINGVVNYFLYPDFRKGNSLWDALGVTGLRNFGCIRSINVIKDSFLCSADYQEGYEDMLSSSLDSPYIWPLIAGIPLLFAMMNALRASRQANALDKAEVQSHILELKKYKSGFWADGLGWLITAAVPELFPPAAFCFMLPQPAIKQALEKITRTIIWDGRLSSQHRQKLFYQLNRFASQRTQFTQMKAMSMLAEIIDQMHFKHLSLLKEEGVDDETLKSIIAIKAKALKELKFLANHYNLPHAPNSLWRPLPRYLYANYLLWLLGYPQQLLLQPLFFAVKSIKWYYTLLFYKAIISGVTELVDRYIGEQNCLSQGKKWAWIDIFARYQCGICADLPVDAYSFSSAEGCFSSYLKVTQGWEAIFKLIERFNASGIHDLDIYTLDLSQQRKVIAQGELPNLLRLLKPKLPKISSFYLTTNHLNLKDIKAIADFIENSALNDLKFAYNTIENGGLSLLTSVFTSINIQQLDLSGISIAPSEVLALMNALTYSKVTSLQLNLGSTKLGDIGIKAMAPGLSLLHSENLEINFSNCGITTEGCVFLANQLQKNQAFINLALILNNNPIDDVCVEALARLFLNKKNLQGDLSLEDNFIGDRGMRALATILPTVALGKLSLSNYNASEESVFTLIDALKNSSLWEFQYIDTRSDIKFNTSILIPRLAEALNMSKLVNFGWSNPNSLGWGDEGAVAFADFITQGIINLGSLELSYNRIGPQGISALIRSLKGRRFGHLLLAHNRIGAGISALVDADFGLDLSDNQIVGSDIHALLTGLYNLKVDPNTMRLGLYLYLANNPIGDDGALNLIRAFRGPPYPYHTSPQRLDLTRTNISAQGAIAIAEALTKRPVELWINSVKNKGVGAATNLHTLTLAANPIGNVGASALYAVWPYINMGALNLTDTGIEGENCGFLSSASRLHSVSPYFLLARFYLGMRRSLVDLLSIQLLQDIKQVTSNINKIDPNQAAVALLEDPIDDSDALEAYFDVMDSEYNSPSHLHLHLLSVCETFLSSVKQSAWLTAIPLFVCEMLYRFGGYPRVEAEKAAQELQTLLVVSLANSPHAMAASLLAQVLMTKLHYSQSLISTVSVGASITASIIATVVNTNASLSWTLTQTGVALTGSLIGSIGMQSFFNTARKGLDYATRAKNSFCSSFSFGQARALQIFKWFNRVIKMLLHYLLIPGKFERVHEI